MPSFPLRLKIIPKPLKINPGIHVWALGTNRDEEMHAGTIVFKMAAPMHAFGLCTFL